MSDGTDRVRLLQPVVSWGVGLGLLIWVTVSDHGGDQTAAWYALIGALLGFPFLTFVGHRNGAPA